MNHEVVARELESIGVHILFDDETDEFYWLNLRSDTPVDVGFDTYNETVEEAARAFGLIDED